MSFDDMNNIRNKLLIIAMILTICILISTYFEYKASYNQNTGNIEIEYGILYMHNKYNKNVETRKDGK